MPSKDGFEQLKSDEGFEEYAHNITTQKGHKEKNLTLGHGYNIDAAEDPTQDLLDAGVPEKDIPGILKGELGITKEQAGLLFEISVKRAADNAARVIPDFDKLDPRLQDVYINMSYQLGAVGFSKFKRLKSEHLAGNLDGVAREILNSQLGRSQASKRAQRLADQVLQLSDEQKSAKKEVNQQIPRYLDIYAETRRKGLINELGSLYHSKNPQQATQPTVDREALVKELAGIRDNANKQSNQTEGATK